MIFDDFVREGVKVPLRRALGQSATITDGSSGPIADWFDRVDMLVRAAAGDWKR